MLYEARSPSLTPTGLSRKEQIASRSNLISRLLAPLMKAPFAQRGLRLITTPVE